MSRTELVEAFAGFPARLGMAARAADGRRVPNGEWGPAEIVRHLIAVEDEVWQSRLAHLVTEDDPYWDWTEPGLAPGFDAASLDEILAAFASARGTTAAAIPALDDAGWARFGIHATYGRLDVEGLLRLAIDHDENHFEALAAQP